MRCVVLVKATAESEAGVMPGEQLLADMGRFNEALVQAGVMQAGEGLHPSRKGVRVHFDGDRRTVTDGPFAETKELVAGFWVWQVASMDEAIEWAKRCPNPMPGPSDLEIRPVFEADDFGPEFTPELREQEERQRATLEARAEATPVQPVPPAQGATPYLTVQGAAAAIAWYGRVFDARPLTRLDAPDGLVMHAEIAIGPARVMLTDERPQYGALGPKAVGGSPVTVVVFVPDVDATVARAVEAGATVHMPVMDQFWGDRSGLIEDPHGHRWFVSTHREDVSPEDLPRRAAAAMAGG